MPKQSLVLGFVKSVQSTTSPGVWTTEAAEEPYKSDILSYNKQYDSGEKVNDDVQFRNRYSIVMKDKKSIGDYANIKYVKIGQTKLKVTALEYLYPRIILTVGGVYIGG